MQEVALSGMDGKWIADQLLKADRTQTDLAEFLKLHVTIINKMIHGKRQIKAHEADRIREFLGSPPAANTATSRGREVRRPAAPATVDLTEDMLRDLPILGTVSGGVGGIAQMENGSGNGFALRPVRLLGRTDVGAFWVEDPSMGDAHPPGTLVVVEKKRPPLVGDSVVFELLPETAREDRIALIKRYAGRTATHHRFEQLNPRKTLEYPLKRVTNLMRVIPLAELLGV